MEIFRNEKYFNFVKPTFIENWPNGLYNMSIAQADVPLTIEQANRLGGNMRELYDVFLPPHHRKIQDIYDAIDKKMGWCPWHFVRLGSRSPKDSFYGYEHGFKIKYADEALKILLGFSIRMMEDLCKCIVHEYPPHIFVRQYKDIPKWSEFRCFMKDRKLIGISQYFYDEVFEELKDKSDRGSIRWAIQKFFDNFKDECHLDDVVFDIWVILKDITGLRYNERFIEVKLIEINPFFEHTDPCLFAWRNEVGQELVEFHGDLRYVKGTEKDKHGKIRRIVSAD